MICAGKGDSGHTGLTGGARVLKSDRFVEALGALDEASAALGLARSFVSQPKLKKLMLAAQRDLGSIMTEISAAGNPSADAPSLAPERIAWLDGELHALRRALPRPPDGFILAGDSVADGALALARTIVRRAERRVVALHLPRELSEPRLVAYLNRLSSFVFYLELTVRQHADNHLGDKDGD